MAKRFKVVVPNNVFQMHNKLYGIMAGWIELMCHTANIAALDEDNLVISGTLKPGYSRDFMAMTRFLNELGYDPPTFVNVDSLQEYEARLSEHVVSVAARLVPSIVPQLTSSEETRPDSS